MVICDVCDGSGCDAGHMGLTSRRCGVCGGAGEYETEEDA